MTHFDQIEAHQLFQNRSSDPSYLWKMIRTGDTSDICDLALRPISLCSDSASCERVFSSCGTIHLKLQTQLSVEKVTSTARSNPIFGPTNRSHGKEKEKAKYSQEGW